MQEKKSEKYNKNENFGSRLRKCRKAKGLSQKILADMLGYKRSGSVSYIENNKTPPDIQSLAKIAEALDVDLHWLITGEVSPSTISAGNAYMPFVKAHMQDIIDKLHGLVGERMDLVTKQAAGEIHTLRLDELQEEIANLQGYYQAILKSLDETLEPLGLKFTYSVDLVPDDKQPPK